MSSADTPSNGGTPSTTYSPFYSSSVMNNAKFNPTMAVIIIVLIGSCFVLGFISVFVRKCMSGPQAAGATGTSGANGTWNPKNRGLDKEAVDALPVVHCSDLGEKDDQECPVCLTEFEPEDNLRLLPTCRHVFHQECIDAWFDAHSTCPLCRASLTGVVVTGGEQGASREPAVATVAEVSESRDSDIEILQPTFPPREDSSQPAGTMAPVSATISREDSLNSARGTLSRNSQLFKRAARGSTALEKAQSLGAACQLRKPPTTPSSRKPPRSPATTTGVHRSSSVGTDLVALRNLLASGDSSGATATSSSWFTRARSMDLGSRARTSLPRTQSGENWSAIDLEGGKRPASQQAESSTAASSWSDRWSLASLRSAMLPLSRSTSDVVNNPRNLPV